MVPRLALAALLCPLFFLFSASAFPQHGKRQEGRERERQMTYEERQRMREEMRDVYRKRQDRPQGLRPQRESMSPEERIRLRRDIEDANRSLKR